MGDRIALKSGSLLLLRIGTGLLLVLWGALRVMSPAVGPGLATKYYSGFMGMQAIQITFGVFEILVGVLVVVGLLRRFAYPLQALILVPGALMASVLAFWRLAADLSYTNEFAISEGVFSHWAPWAAIAIALALIAQRLNHYGRSGRFH